METLRKHEILRVANDSMTELAKGDHTLVLGLVDYLKDNCKMNIADIIRIASKKYKIEPIVLARTWLVVTKLTKATVHMMPIILGVGVIASMSACGVKFGNQNVIGTTSFLEEVNKGNFASNLDARVRENLSEEDRNHLSVRLAEVK